MSKLKQLQKTLAKHSPDILIGVAITSIVGAPILAVQATPKALQAIEVEKEKKQVDKLAPMDTVKTCWQYYIPTAAACVTSVACLLASNTVYAKRTAALTAAYKLSETALTEYQAAVRKTIGEKEEKVVREQVSQTRVEQNPVSKNEIFVTGAGDTQFLEPVSNRYFKADIEQVKKVENMLNKRMLHDMFGYISLSDFYDEIGLSHTDISDDIGWNLDKGMIDIEFHPVMGDNGRPCLALYYNNAPKWGYDK